MKILREIEWRLDYYLMYFMYKPQKIHRYHEYMRNKWGDRYCSEEDYKNYLNKRSNVPE